MRKFIFADGYELMTDGNSTPAKATARLDTLEDALELYSKLKTDIISIVIVEDEYTGFTYNTYLNRVFGSFTILTEPDISPVKVSFTLNPPPFDESSTFEDVSNLKNEINKLKTEISELKEKSNAYDIIINGE